MVRPKRVWSPEHFHHVVSRGNWRANLFQDELDFASFLNVLGYTHRLINFEISSYCLMSNHYHLLMRSEEVSLSKVMARINKSYADYYNKRYEVSGHLFEKRFFSKPVYDLYGLLKVSQYIHLNPFEADIAPSPQEYRWSSYPYYYFSNTNVPPYMNLSLVSELFSGKNLFDQKRNYCKWMMNELKIETLHLAIDECLPSHKML